MLNQCLAIDIPISFEEFLKQSGMEQRENMLQIYVSHLYSGQAKAK